MINVKEKYADETGGRRWEEAHLRQSTWDIKKNSLYPSKT